jgi:hypothetical protein
MQSRPPTIAARGTATGGLRRSAFGATIHTPRPPLLTLIAAPFSSRLSRHTEDEILALEREHSIEFALSDGGSERAITGHIDFLQVRNGSVHILDSSRMSAPTN